tara:strand:+ start:2369 stop:2608 length:240 start_codon:yes stop_codon:yes gene_type:complete
MSKIKIKNEHLLNEFLGTLINLILKPGSNKAIKRAEKNPEFKKLSNKIKKDAERNSKKMDKLIDDDPELKKYLATLGIK